MASHIHETPFFPPDPTENTFDRSQDLSLSINAVEGQHSIGAERKDTGNDDVQSFVIVNDIDVDEEITKAQKDNKSFFKVLSMSFYGKLKSHSLDTQDPRDIPRPPITPQGGLKSMLARKQAANTPPESKRNTLKVIPEPKVQQKPNKKATPAGINTQVSPENVRKRLLSPKEEPKKAASPVVSDKLFQTVNRNPGKTTPKKEDRFLFDSQKKVPMISKIQYTQDVKMPRTSVSPGLKTTPTGRSGSPNEMKKIAGKMTKPNLKILDNIEDKVNILDIEPSILDMKPFVESPEKTPFNQAPIPLSKQSSKPSSRMSSNKSINDNKSRMTPTGSNRVTSANLGGSHPKTSNKGSTEMKEGVVDQQLRNNGDEKQYLEKQQAGQKASKKMTRVKEQKTKSQESGIVMLDDSDIEDDLKRPLQTQETTTPSRLTQKKILFTTEGPKSPNNTKKGLDRPPLKLNSGLGNWTMKPVLLTRDYTTPQNKKTTNVRGSPSPDTKNKRTTPQPTKLSDTIKQSSYGKLNKTNALSQWKGKEVEREQTNDTKVIQTPFFKTSNERNTRLSEKPKDKKQKIRPTSPVTLECKKTFDLLDKLLSQKKGAKERLQY